MNPTAAFVTLIVRLGWKIERTSCACGGTLAWLKPRPSGAMEMVGCICHNNSEELIKEGNQIEIKAKVRHEEKICPACRKGPLSIGFTGNFCRNEDCNLYKIQI